MNALSNFLNYYANSGISRLHMPGHKGNCSFLQSLGAAWDITEISGSDSLYHASGIIAQLEQQISQLYHAQSVISAGGSTLCIQTMVNLCKGRHIIAMRNSHVSFFHACSLLGVQPKWIAPTLNKKSGLINPPSAAEVEVMLSKSNEPCAVYLTSPDYFGSRVDIKKFSAICRKHNALLMVDNAHGAHFRFLQNDIHPISLGADLCCDSLHKTLPALTGSALLHSRPGLFAKETIKASMAIFGSSSPSYLIMQSIGLCADWLQTKGAIEFELLQRRHANLLRRLDNFALPADCCKLTLNAAAMGQTGEQLGNYFHHHKIEPEYIDRHYIVFMLSCFMNELDWQKLHQSLDTMPISSPLCLSDIDLSLPKSVMPMHLALKQACRHISIDASLGKIASQPVFLCPPGIPIVAAGEKIDENIYQSLKNSGIFSIYVLK